MIRFSCTCGQHMSAAAEHAGKTVACPACGKPSSVPQTPAEPPTLTASSTARLHPVRIECPSCQTADWVSPADLGSTVSCSKCSYEYLAEACPIDARPPDQAPQNEFQIVYLGKGSKVVIDLAAIKFGDIFRLALMIFLANLILAALVFEAVFFLALAIPSIPALADLAYKLLH